MNHRIIYYAKLTALDIFRLWPSVQHHVIIVAGICLPILLLLGLKNGEVAKLREKILASPNATEVLVWMNSKNSPFNANDITDFRSEMNGLYQAIPAIQKIVSLSSARQSANTVTLDKLTASATAAKDPKLAARGCDITNGDVPPNRAVILKDSVAEKLNVKKGDEVNVHVKREIGSEQYESASLAATVVDIYYPEGSDGSDIYMSDETLLRFVQYTSGGRVKEFNWPALKAPAPDTYAGYLVFSRKNEGGLTDEDRRTLAEHKYAVNEIDASTLKALSALFNPDFEEELHIYSVQPKRSIGTPWGFCDDHPRDLTELTSTKDIAIFWNAPKPIKLDGIDFQAIGLTLPRRTWLKKYIKSPETTCFSYNDNTLLVSLEGDNLSETGELTLNDSHKVPVSLRTRPSQVRKDSIPESIPREQPSPVDNSPNDSTNSGAKQTLTKDEAESSLATDSNGDTPIDQAELEKPDNSSPLDDESSNTSLSDPPAKTGQANKSTGSDASNSTGPTEENSSAVGIDAPGFSPTLPKGASPTNEQLLSAPVETVTGEETPEKAGSPKQTNSPLKTAVLPCDFLAYLYALQSEQVEYDNLTNLFVPITQEARFPHVRAYAMDIDRVPEVVQQFQSRGYATDSNVSLIKELRKNTSRLAIIVTIVAIGVFFFGTITVVSLLLDSTARKKGTIGIMRVMGVSRFGIFFTVFMRATIIAVLAAVVTVFLGFGFKFLLSPVIAINIGQLDILYVVLGAIICCTLGSLLPAFYASRMDPFDAIVEGRFR